MMDLEQLVEIFKSKNDYLLFGHTMPDGDAFGSVLALGMALKKLGKKVQMVMPEQPGNAYDFLPEFASILDASGVKQDEMEVVVALDCATPERADRIQHFLEKSPYVINIDHHISNTRYGDYNLVEPQAAATGEIVYNLIKHLGVELDAKIATCLFVAIATDTGSFKYANTTSQTHRIIAQLLEYDINHPKIMRRLFDVKPLCHMQLLGRALMSLQTGMDGKMAWAVLTRQDLAATAACDEDAEGIIDAIKSVAGVEIAVFFRETENGKIKIGFRSHEWVDVNEIAAQFNGGGHARAAGCLMEGSIHEVIPKILGAVEEKAGDNRGRHS